VVDHQRAYHQQQQRQDHRTRRLHRARHPRMRRQDPRRCLAEREQRQQQERQIDQQVVVGTERLLLGVVVDVVRHQQVDDGVHRQRTEEVAPLRNVADQPAHHSERRNAQVLDVEHALHVGHRVVINIDAGGKRLRVHEEQHTQQRGHGRVDQADAEPFAACTGQDEHQRHAVKHIQEQTDLRRDIGTAGAQRIDHVEGHASAPQQQGQRGGTPTQRGAIAAGPPQAGGGGQQRSAGQEHEGTRTDGPWPHGQDQAVAQHIQQRQHYRHASPDRQGRMGAR